MRPQIRHLPEYSESPKEITAVCISEKRQTFSLDLPFVSYTEGYRPVPSRDTASVGRIEYLTNRYNDAVRRALQGYPDTEHIFIIDHYYLPFIDEVQTLVNDYLELDNAILGASIWYWSKKRIRPWIAYYDTMSAPEFKGNSWKNSRALPRGIIPVSGVGACWIFPRMVWERTSAFTIPSPPQAGSSRGLDTSGYRVLLDCNSRLWRTHETNPAIPDERMVQRVINTVNHAKQKFLKVIGEHG